MKQILTLIAFLSLFTFSQAQISWDNAKADTARGFETNPDIETHNVVTFDVPGNYRWVRTYSEICSVKTAICDKNSCYLETTDSADFTVVADETFDMICHFYPYNKCCPEGATVSLYVYKIDDPSVNSTATYVLDLWCASLSATSVGASMFVIAPNPSQNSIQLLNAPNNTQSISVVNILGEKVIESSEVTNSIDISTLKSGIYWVALKSEGVTYTQRFIKQ
ncbi:MAG: hypothetical protein ACI8SE_000176 [Bacteroidia bacterium]|jgi:hypothetical protein